MSVIITGDFKQFDSVRIGTYSDEAYNLLRVPQVLPVTVGSSWGDPNTIRVSGYTNPPADLTSLTATAVSEAQTHSATVIFYIRFEQARKIDFITAGFSAYGSVILINVRGYDDDKFLRSDQVVHSATHNGTVVRRPPEPTILTDIRRKYFTLSFASTYDWMTVGRVGVWGR